MERELLRKNAATSKRRPSSNESQPVNNEGKRDDIAAGQRASCHDRA